MLTQKKFSDGRVFPGPFGGYEVDGKIPPMALTKIEAFKQEFPWVSRLLGDNTFGGVYVNKMDPHILRYQPESVNVGGSLSFPEYVTEMLLLLDQDGNLVVQESEVSIKRRKYVFFGPLVTKTKNHRVDGRVHRLQTVGETLKVLGGSAERVRFILSFYEPTNTVIVYKVPRGFSMRSWIDEQLLTEQEELRRACREIDAAAEPASQV